MTVPVKKLKRLRREGYLNLLILIGLISAFLWSAKSTRLEFTAFADARNIDSIRQFVSGLWPMELAPEFLKDVVRLVSETVAISVAGTVLAVIMAVPLTIGATRVRGEEFSRRSRGTVFWVYRWGIYYMSRSLLNLGRGIPELLWALIFVVAVGLGPFPGVLALAVHSTGILGKLYSEVLEAVDQRLVEAGRATGAGELAVLAFVRIPASLPVLLSYTLFRWECNMRSATLLGLVGAGGIGTQLTISMQLFAYNEVSSLVAAILLLVVAVDLIGQFIRTRLLDNKSYSAQDDEVNCLSEGKIVHAGMKVDQ